MRWAFTSFYWANWHPVAWLSHLLDASLFGPAPGPAHLVNLLCHALASLLCLLALRRLTGALWPSLFVAAVFAVHPLHVESVAWVMERKDLLSAVFWFLGLLAYRRYAARPGAARYAAVAALFALGLMTKPMVVTFPAVLLLLDWWPLGRVGAAAGGWRGAGRLALEKVPLLLLAGAAGVVAVASQRAIGAVVATAKIPVGLRLVNALESYVAYLRDTLWPVGLSAFYPFRLGARPWWAVAGAAALLAAITAGALLLRRRRPQLLAGWLWYLGTLLPVIGVLQVGVQARADRFMYLPLVGLLVAAAWGFPPGRRFRGGAPLVAFLSASAVVALAVVAERQARHWRTPGSLYARMIAVDPENWLGHNGYGAALWEQGRREEALGHYRAAARLNPASTESQTNLAYALDALGRAEEAIGQFRFLVRQTPRNGYARRRLGRLLGEAGRLDESLAVLREALRLEPSSADAWTEIGATYEALGRRADAEAAYREALRLRRVSPEAWERLQRLQSGR